ncbi:MAG: hypothetical protein LC659_15925, partial [Myxococcales bacterium]|nr:hypothetical protein [Myxococcales bacterium]
MTMSTPPGKKDLRDLTHAETRAFADELGVEPYRGDQIFRWVHGRRVSRVEAMTDLGKDLRARVGDAAEVRTLAVDAEQVSKDGTRKLRLRTSDGRMIETVLIPDGDAAAPDDDLDDGGARAEKEEPEHLQ